MYILIIVIVMIILWLCRGEHRSRMKVQEINPYIGRYGLTGCPEECTREVTEKFETPNVALRSIPDHDLLTN